jgi:beta-lactamase regulating signal transducer with metallopeptidase domain
VPQAAGKVAADGVDAFAKPQAAEATTTVRIVKTLDFATGASATTAPVNVATVSAPTFDWRRALLAIWIVGATLLVLRVVIAHVLLTRRLRGSPSVERDILTLLDDCRRELSVSTRVNVIATDAVGGPALFGFVRPKLLIPPGMLRDLSTSDLRFVFLHELAHLKRRDTLINIPLTLAAALHWFNPLVWFALSRCRTERELACDAMVLEVTDGTAQESYGHTMLRLAEALCTTRGRRRAMPAALGILETRSQLTRRITMISAFRRGASSRSSRWSVLPAVLLVGVASCALTDKVSSDAGATTRPARADATEMNQLTERARRLVDQGRYDEALVTIDRLHELDPSNEWAVGIRPLIKDRSQLEGQRRHRDEFDREFSKSLAPAATAADAPSVDAQTQRVNAALDARVAELNFDAKPFTDVIDQLRDVSKQDIFVNWRALEAAGIDRQAPVTARLRNAKVAKALRVVLDEVGGGTVKLGYEIDDGVVTITTDEDLNKNTLTKVYDIRDLTIEIPEWAPAGEVAARPKPQPSTQPGPTLTEQIISLIQETVVPDAWRDAGGTVGAIRELSGQLIITATPQMHEDICKLLAMLREGHGMQVTVETRFFAADAAALDKALGGMLRGTIGKSGEATVWQLTDDQVRAIQANPGSTVVTAPRITLFNGQRGFVTISNETPYVSGFTVFKKEAGETRYEPKVDKVLSGVVLDVRATASADRKQAVITLKPKLSRLDALVPTPYMGAKDMFIQVPQVVVHELQTTFSVADRGTALIGGFTVVGESQGSGPTAHVEGDAIVVREGAVRTKVQIPEGGKLLLRGDVPATGPAQADGLPRSFIPKLRDNENLFLLVKPTLIIARPERPKEFPILSTPAR